MNQSSLHHSFDMALATELRSIELAIIIHHFQHWINKNAALGRNFHEDRTWTYQTLEEIAATFPYWSRDQINRLLRKAVQLKILIKGNFNKSTYDRTCWYAFANEERFSISRNRESHLAISPNGYDEIATPIPDTKTDIKRNNCKETVAKEKPTSLVVVLEKQGISSSVAKRLSKNYSSEEIEKSLDILNRGDPPNNRSAWLTSCLKEKWWQYTPPTAEENKKLVVKELGHLNNKRRSNWTLEILNRKVELVSLTTPVAYICSYESKSFKKDYQKLKDTLKKLGWLCE